MRIGGPDRAQFVRRLLGTAALIAGAMTMAGTLSAQEEFYHPELEWRTIETAHFAVHYHTGTERTARTAAKIAEEIYGPITALYDHEPDGRVNFVIKDYDDYSNGAAYFFDNKIEIWASSLDTDLRGTHNWLRNVITHEFTHIIQIQTSFKFGRRVPAIYLQWLGYESERRQDVLYGYPNRIVSYPLSGFVIPSWFAEGVAQFNRKELDYDFWDSHRDMILRCYALDGNMLGWNEMAVFGKTSLGNESSYNAGFSFVSFLVDRYGDDVLEKISRNLSSLTEVTIDAAIGSAVGEEGEAVYRDWREALRDDYTERIAPVRASVVEGTLIGDVGFANLYPAFSPGGKTVAYISNKNGDYFSSSSLYIYDMAAGTEKRLISGVRSNFSWSPDGKTIYYSKNSRDNRFWSNYYDIFAVDVGSGDERRVTRALRANAPAVSPDGNRLAFVAGTDGTVNLYVSNIDGSDMRALTAYDTAQQAYNPAWSPDGKWIVYDYSLKDGRDLMKIPADGGIPVPLIATADDERTAAFAPDGNSVYFASDRTGIFNIYRYDLGTGDVVQMTNVVGGAFMPEPGPGGSLACSQYTSSGYKLALLSNAAPLSHPPQYVRKGGPGNFHAAFPGSGSRGASEGTDGPIPGAVGNAVQKSIAFDWTALRDYDDTKLPEFTDRKYNNATTSLTVIPFLRVDNYNPRNRGIDVLKPGAYLFSSDVLDRFGFFASAAMNLKGERDLFFTFDYHGAIPGFFDLGMDPSKNP
ncbi:MAG TPA: LpqB family beta-propeller domain-containing protein, partial [Bacteroidota bacterium]|nr:LpqB family beta-propeller domain-containing protein [Bacteroidota bacterium]